MMKIVPLLGLALLAITSFVFAREGGGGSFRGAGMEDADLRDDAPRLDEDNDNYRVSDSNGSADVNVRPEGDDTANVNVRTADGQDYDATVTGPEGFRAGYVWQNGDYVAVNCDPWAPYAVPFGAWAGWSIVTQPDFVQYPVYSTYPVETAVEVALQKLGLYNGPIDGLAASCAGAIEQYQMQNSTPVTGTISPDLLTALGIQASYQ